MSQPQPGPPAPAATIAAGDAIPTAEDVQPIGSGGPGTCVVIPRGGRRAAWADLLPGVALHSPKSADTACYMSW